jgi:hypothetical protein
METIEDIISELRNQGKYNKENVDLDWKAEEVGDLQIRVADRIEEAVEYKLAIEKAKAAGEGYVVGKQSVTDCNSLGNIAKMREALTTLVDYLNKEVKRTSKCNRCKYRDKTFRGEPCNWHVDCGIEDYDRKASDNAMHLLKRFKLQGALSSPARNCDLYATEDEAWEAFCEVHPDAKCPSEYWSEQYQMWLFEQMKGVSK